MELLGKGAQSGHWNLFEEAIQNGILPGEGPPLEEFRKERKHLSKRDTEHCC